MVKEYKETHQQGTISLENMPRQLRLRRVLEGDFGVQIAEDGRVWVCIDGVAFIRFKPGSSEELSQLLDWFRKRQRATKSSTLTMDEFDKKYQQLYGIRPTWYSWGPFYRDHGLVGLRSGER